MLANDTAVQVWREEAPGDFQLRFLDRVGGYPDPGRCWLWTRCTGPRGHGRVRLPEGLGGRVVFAHRVMWLALRGPIPFGQVLDHGAGCGNPTCCNPDHLRVTDQATNVRETTRGPATTSGMVTTPVSIPST
jgi:hypothetical protein